MITILDWQYTLVYIFTSFIYRSTFQLNLCYGNINQVWLAEFDCRLSRFFEIHPIFHFNVCSQFSFQKRFSQKLFNFGEYLGIYLRHLAFELESQFKSHFKNNCIFPNII